MEIKDAVRKAKQYAAEFLSEESQGGFHLEEVQFNNEDSTWEITLGFYTKDDKPAHFSSVLDAMEKLKLGTEYQKRYKIFRLRATDGAFVSMKMREATMPV